jgi:hypothetical protein
MKRLKKSKQSQDSISHPEENSVREEAFVDNAAQHN